MRVTYNLNAARLIDGILSELGVVNRQKRNAYTDINNTNQQWRNLIGGIIKTIEFKYPKTKTIRINNDETLNILRNNRTTVNYDIFQNTKYTNTINNQ